MPTIITKNLTHIYSQGSPFESLALGGVHIEIRQGEFVAIIGHTGSGKSTFVQHLNGLLLPTRGQVLLDGTDINQNKKLRHNARFQVGLVFQYPEYQLFEETVYRDIAFGPRNMKLSKDEIDERVREAAGFVGVPEALFDKSPLELSGGQKRRVAIAGVIAMRPEVLVLDEPVDGLDPVMRRQVWSILISDVAEHGTTVLVSSHNLRELEDVCDHVGIMNKGSLLLERNLSDLQENIAKVQLALPDGAALPEGLNILHHNSTGRLQTIILRGKTEEITNKLATAAPLFMDVVPLSLEEIFIYELGGEHYAVKDIIL